MRQETVLITGVLGQDGAYLARHAIEEGHRVVGGVRPGGAPDTWRLAELGIGNRVELVEIDLLDPAGLEAVIERARPTRVFNLAAQSFIVSSFEAPVESCAINAMGPLHLLEALRKRCPEARFFQASSAEMFGQAQVSPQSEATPLDPRSPYGAAKTFAHHLTRGYRELYGMHACSGILFNHESPLRPTHFLTRKVTATFARMTADPTLVLTLGNLDARRDWGHARDFVRAMWAMTEHTPAQDFVLATGTAHTIRHLVQLCAGMLGWDLAFEGEGAGEVGFERSSGRRLVEVSADLFRPSEPTLLMGDASKARELLGWTPKTSLEELMRDMIQSDLRRADATQNVPVRSGD